MSGSGQEISLTGGRKPCKRFSRQKRIPRTRSCKLPYASVTTRSNRVSGSASRNWNCSSRHKAFMNMESYIVVSEGLPESVSLCYNLGIVNAEVAEAQRTQRKNTRNFASSATFPLPTQYFLFPHSVTYVKYLSCKCYCYINFSPSLRSIGFRDKPGMMGRVTYISESISLRKKTNISRVFLCALCVSAASAFTTPDLLISPVAD